MRVPAHDVDTLHCASAYTNGQLPKEAGVLGLVGIVRNNILNLGNRRREVFIVNRFRVIVSDGIIGIKMREKDRVSEHHAGKEALF